MLNNIPCKVCNDRDDHRPAAAELAPDPSAQCTAHLLLELVSVFCPGKHRILKVQHDLGADFIKLAFIFSNSIQVDLRPADDLIPVSVYYNETGNKAFLAQDAALLQLIFCDLADRSTIDIDVSAGDTANDSSLSMVQVNDITVLGKETAPADHVYDITGSLCENNDKFAIDRALPKIDIGDIVVIHDTGAHGSAMGFNYNGKLWCAELLLRTDGTIELIRRAQTLDDYFATLRYEGGLLS